LLHAGSVRKFGLYFYNNDSYVPATPKPLKDRLAACGAAIARQDDFEFVNNGGGSYVQQAVTSWNADGVTTAICLGGDDTLCPFVMNGAVADQYYPEWISTTFGVGDRNFAWHIWGAPETELKGLFGLTFTPRQLAPLNEPWWWAAHEGDPSIPYTGSDAISWQNSFEYHSFLAIAAGIQMAGPNLTPATFMRGLQRAEFPNPPSANMEGAVSLAGGGHTWTQDAAVWWWSPTARSPYSDEQAGTVCYYEHGARFAPGDLRPLPPGQDPLFRGTCDSGA
jgi:hypothetical protein